MNFRRHPNVVNTTPFAIRFARRRLKMYMVKTEHYKSRALTTKPEEIDAEETPSFWFHPEEVWEIMGADLTSSPVHTAGRGDR